MVADEATEERLDDLHDPFRLYRSMTCPRCFNPFRDWPWRCFGRLREKQRCSASIWPMSVAVALTSALLTSSSRLEAVGLADHSTFIMPLTQGRIADVVGLSVPHINRMLRRLRDDGLIEMKGQRMQILDRDALSALADFDDSYLARRQAISGFSGSVHNFVARNARHADAFSGNAIRAEALKCSAATRT